MSKIDRITVDPAVMGGRACIRGMRVPVSLVLNLVANGSGVDDVLAAYPYLEAEDIHQCLTYVVTTCTGGDGQGLRFTIQ